MNLFSRKTQETAAHCRYRGAMKREHDALPSDQEPVRISIESIIALGVAGWLAMAMILMALGIW